MREDIVPFLTLNGKLFNILFVGISYCDNNYKKVRPNSHVYSFEYVTKGNGHIICENKEFFTQPGDAYILPQNADHYISSLGDHEKIWFTTNSQMIKNLLNDYDMGGLVFLKNFNESKIFKEIFNCAKESTDIDAQYKIALLIHELISSFSMFRHNKNAEEEKTPSEIIKEYIENDLSRRISIRELSDLVYLSPSRLINIFKKEYGCSPCAYSLKIKINEAKILLANSDISIKQIASELGFDDPKYFSKYFKFSTGVSPAQYRKET